MTIGIIKSKNVTVYPDFDSGRYKGKYTICGEKISEFHLSKEDFNNISILIVNIVEKYLEQKKNEK